MLTDHRDAVSLKAEVLAAGSTKDWSHITSQIGMQLLGLKPDQVEKLETSSIFTSQRMGASMAVFSKNVKMSCDR